MSRVGSGLVCNLIIRFAREAVMAPLLRGIFICWICGKRVSLEDCKIDELGKPVHEECYVAKLALRKG
jgi:hypothetical protein